MVQPIAFLSCVDRSPRFTVDCRLSTVGRSQSANSFPCVSYENRRGSGSGHTHRVQAKSGQGEPSPYRRRGATAYLSALTSHSSPVAGHWSLTTFRHQSPITSSPPCTNSCKPRINSHSSKSHTPTEVTPK